MLVIVLSYVFFIHVYFTGTIVVSFRFLFSFFKKLHLALIRAHERGYAQRQLQHAVRFYVRHMPIEPTGLERTGVGSSFPPKVLEQAANHWN